ncbi:hypothetical protein [Microbacterium sp. KR10-403]|uniref:hypothetical protein n=1 Tax=Microbacterium sp. KR10-403 TaxID=3158581 RepID=UPI0032E4FC04
MMADVQMFTLGEVAERLQLPYEVVRDAVYAGRWPHTAFTPRNRRMSQADIDRVVEMLHHEPAPQSRSDARRRTAHVKKLMRAV